MTATSNTIPEPDDGYPDFLVRLRTNFTEAALASPMFTTDAVGIFGVFLDSLPAERRQQFTCRACRDFVEAYGGLVTIGEDGRTSPVFWRGYIPVVFQFAVAAVFDHIQRARVNGVFLTAQGTLGRPVTGAWHHMAATLPPERLFRETALKNAGQAMAEKREEYAMLSRGLAEFGFDVAKQAETLLQAEALYRSEKVLGVAKWLRTLHGARNAVGKDSRRRENVVWRAVATAPPGFAHVRSTMVGTLLSDLAEGMTLDVVKRRFDEKMNPTKYQRPTAPPNEGNIALAEKVVAELQAAGALARRYARLEDLGALWRPAEKPDPGSSNGGGVFDHLREAAQKACGRRRGRRARASTPGSCGSERMPCASARPRAGRSTTQG